MPSNVVASRWLTAKTLHQIQVLSCDYCEFTCWESPDHCAPLWRLYWHDRRGGVIHVGGRTIEILPGNLFLIPPNTHFASTLKRPFKQLFIHFLVEPHFRREGDVVYPIKATQGLAKRCAAIIEEITQDTTSIRTSLHAQVLLGLVLLTLPLERWQPRFEDLRITRAVERIGKAYPKRVSNAVLAKEAGLHPQAFIRLFRQCTGDTPLQHLLNLRLEEACSMLHYDAATLEEIAERTGFGDRHYFSRIFSRAMNCSPARYRKLVNVSHRLRPGI